MQSQPNRQQGAGATVPGIIDTIAGAMSLALARPLLLLVPVLVDLYLWLGVRISPEALTDELRRLVLKANSTDSASLADSLHHLGATGDLTSAAAVLVPSAIAGIDREKIDTLWTRTDVIPSTWWLVCLVAIGLMLVGFAISMVYRVPLAMAVRGDARRPMAIALAVAKAWLRFIALAAIVVGLFLLIVGPVVMIGVVFAALGANILPFLTFLLIFPLAWAAIYLYFVIDAIVVSEVGPFRAIYLSFNVVRRNFWPTVGFAVVVLLISTGLSEIWVHFLGTIPGLIFAVLANAFVGTGLALASMMFYYDRLRRWHQDATYSPGLAVLGPRR